MDSVSQIKYNIIIIIFTITLVNFITVLLKSQGVISAKLIIAYVLY